MTPRRLVLPLVLVMALAAACNGDDGSSAEPTTTRDQPTTPTTAPSTTTATEPADPFAVPDPITEDYVQRVLEAHEEIVAEAGRLAYEAGGITPEIEEMFRSIRVEAYAQGSIDELASFVEEGLPNAQPDRGPRGVDVTLLRAATEDCIGVQAVISLEEVLIEPVPPREVVIELTPLPAERNPAGHNPTPWIEASQYLVDEDGAPEPCAD